MAIGESFDNGRKGGRSIYDMDESEGQCLQARDLELGLMVQHIVFAEASVRLRPACIFGGV